MAIRMVSTTGIAANANKGTITRPPHRGQGQRRGCLQGWRSATGGDPEGGETNHGRTTDTRLNSGAPAPNQSGLEGQRTVPA